MSDPIRSISQNNYLLSNGGGGGSYTAGEFIDITNDVISVNSGDVSNLIPGSGILITQSSTGTTVSIDPEELPTGGSEETVLYDGAVIASADNTVVSLSGNPTDYSRIGLFGFGYETGKWQYCEVDPSYSGTISTFEPYPNGSNVAYNVDTLSFSGTDQITFRSCKHWYNGSNYTGGLNVYKIIGIGRKE